MPILDSEVMQSTGDFHDEIVIHFLGIAEEIFDNATCTKDCETQQKENLRAAAPGRLSRYPLRILWRGADRVDKDTGAIVGIEKIPINPHTLYGGSTTDSDNWHIPPNYVVEDAITQRKPPEVRLWTWRHRPRSPLAVPAGEAPRAGNRRCGGGVRGSGGRWCAGGSLRANGRCS